MFKCLNDYYLGSIEGQAQDILVPEAENAENFLRQKMQKM